MKTDKKTITESFSRAAESYDENSELQKEVSQGLALMIGGLLEKEFACRALRVSGTAERAPTSGGPRRVLDIGCGTGRLIAALKSSHPELDFTGMDIARPMVLQARRKTKGLKAAVSDCEALPFADCSFDMAVSSLTLQWASSIVSAFKEAGRVLRPGGVFLFTTLGPRTLYELRECYSGGSPPPIEFLDKDTVAEGLVEAGLEIMEIEEKIEVKRYDNLRALARVLRDIGAAPAQKEGGCGLSRAAALRRAEREYSLRFPSCDGRGILASYEVISAAAKKPL